ncbi:SDR family NAD(P)-dependent oxidoreductase [Rhizobium sullae]|uniref:SDR family NAD(P)-dependent oxidoreductase n=1 Tax=Rhizobium sullae TaxID=50338 RepID=UPI000B354907|nr:SDR family NAD(P)-dependent oxidoreductase [Rhizobium sullae]
MTAARTVLVTGASGGIGRGVCEALAEEARLTGHSLRLAVHGSRESMALSALVSDLTSADGEGEIEARAFVADLTDACACNNLIGQVIDWAGRLDSIVSNAGQSRPGKLANLPDEDWQATLDLNLRATWLLARAAYPALTETRGTITAVASMSGLSPHPGYGAYSTAKAGLVMLCRQLAQEWAGDGIRVNAVCPGMIRTPLTETVYQDEDTRRKRESLVPLGRIGTPRDIGDAVAFLTSDKASYITGVALRIDGGLSEGMLNLIPGRPDKVR